MLRVGILGWLVGASVASIAIAQAPNTLTDAEKAQGWLLMFDGKTPGLPGWHSFRKSGITENGWILKDSAIYMRGPAAGALLAPEAFMFKNFEISIDWKLPDSGNSGIFMRYLETEESENVRTGPETQICGKSHTDYRGGIANTSPGACYAMYAPSQPWIRPAEEYNTLDVIMYEEKVAHFGNGKRLLEYSIGDPDWTAKYGVSKYQTFPLYGDIHAGKLLLQDHASHVWYRNIKIRPLTEDPWKMAGFQWPDERVGLVRRGGLAGPGGLFLSAANGRLRLVLEKPGRFELRLGDILGRGRAALAGNGTGTTVDAGLSPGRYWLRGNLDGKPVAGSVSLPAL